jgi:hypothetical protein
MDMTLEETPAEPKEADARIKRYNALRDKLLTETKVVEGFISRGDPGHALLSHLRQISEDLAGDSFKVGLFGVTAAGKSTLTNALLGDSILREGLGETTKTLTMILAPEKGRGHREALLRYKTLDTVHREIDQHLRNTGFGYEEGLRINLDDPAFRTALWENVKGAVNGDPEQESSCRFMKHLLQGWDRCRDRLGTEVVMPFAESESLVHDEKIATFIDRRILYYDHGMTKDGFVFFDAPGVGAACARHTEEAVRLAQMVDAAILVTKVDYQFMPPDRKFLHDAMDVQRMQDRHNLIFVLNQIGKISPMQAQPPKKWSQFDECVNEQVDRLRERLADSGIHDAVIYPVDAACGRWSRKYMDSPNDEDTEITFSQYAFPNCGRDPVQNLETSRLPELEEGLVHRLTSIRYHGLLAGKHDSLNHVINEYRKENLANIDNMKKNHQQLVEKLQEHSIHRRKILETLSEFFDILLPGLLKKNYADLEQRIDQVVERILDILLKDYIQLCNRPFATHQQHMRQAVKNSEAKIISEIEKLRNEYESKYSKIKRDALDDRIPQIIKTYGDSINFDLIVLDLQEPFKEVIGGLGVLELHTLQKVKKFFVAFAGLRKEKERELVKKGLGVNFRKAFAERFKKDITAWVLADQDEFKSQIISRFSLLMDQIETDIKAAIRQKDAVEEDQGKAAEKLAGFVKTCEAASLRIAGLQKEIDRSRTWLAGKDESIGDGR